MQHEVECSVIQIMFLVNEVSDISSSLAKNSTIDSYNAEISLLQRFCWFFLCSPHFLLSYWAAMHCMLFTLLALILRWAFLGWAKWKINIFLLSLGFRWSRNVWLKALHPIVDALWLPCVPGWHNSSRLILFSGHQWDNWKFTSD